MLGSQKHTDMFKNNVNVFADEMPLANMQKKKDPEKLTDTLSNKTEEIRDSYHTEFSSSTEKKDTEKRQ